MGSGVEAERPGGDVTRLPPMRAPGEWIAFGALGAIAGVMFFAGISLLAPTVSLVLYAANDERAAVAVRASLCFAAIFGTAGFVSRRLIRSRRPLFPNEREARVLAQPVDGWLLALAFALAVMPLATFHELAPLRSLWSEAIRLLRDSHILDGALHGGNLSGLVLLPVAMALFTPLLQMAAAAMFAVGSVTLSVLLWTRSARFVRGYVVCLLLQAALVFTSAYSTVLARRAADWVGQQAGATAGQMRDLEHVRVLEAVERYDDVLQETSRSLALTLLAYALWLPALLLSPRARRTFATPAQGPETASAGVNPRSMDTAARKRFYEAAARALQQSGD